MWTQIKCTDLNSSRIEDSITSLFRFYAHVFYNNKTYPIIRVQAAQQTLHSSHRYCPPNASNRVLLFFNFALVFATKLTNIVMLIFKVVI